MSPAVRGLRNAYGQLKMPVVIVAGAEDQFIESEQSTKLHRDIPGSILRLIPATGHMVHQTATAEIMSAIDTAADQRSHPLATNAA
jgi:pimeloyl-ACP methyl ester carboxylesterase